jgi:hypothetical protein
MSELQNWLKEQKGVEQINRLGYRLWYNEKWCYAQITITPYTEEVAIKPMQITDDIGKGKGVPVYMSFKRDLEKETTSNQITLRVFSDYQLEQLKEMFAKHIVEKIARVDEDGSLFIEYRGGIEWGDWDGVMKSKSIPVRPLENKDR